MNMNWWSPPFAPLACFVLKTSSLWGHKRTRTPHWYLSRYDDNTLRPHLDHIMAIMFPSKPVYSTTYQFSFSRNDQLWTSELVFWLQNKDIYSYIFQNEWQEMLHIHVWIWPQFQSTVTVPDSSPTVTLSDVWNPTETHTFIKRKH